MSKLFENEQNIADKEDIFQSDDDEAGKLLQTWNTKNDPCYRKVVLQHTSKITYCRICMNTKTCVCFRV